MSATTGGAIKAHLERPTGPVRGVAWYRDRAPKDAPMPCGVIQEGIGQTRVPMGDTQDPDADKVVLELVQVTLFQTWRSADGKAAENYTLPGLVWKDLDGARPATAPTGVSGMAVRGRVRTPAVDGVGAGLDPANGANVVQDVFTIAITRSA